MNFFWLFRDHLGFFNKNDNQILNNVIIKFHVVKNIIIKTNNAIILYLERTL